MPKCRLDLFHSSEFTHWQWKSGNPQSAVRPDASNQHHGRRHRGRNHSTQLHQFHTASLGETNFVITSSRVHQKWEHVLNVNTCTLFNGTHLSRDASDRLRMRWSRDVRRNQGKKICKRGSCFLLRRAIFRYSID